MFFTESLIALILFGSVQGAHLHAASLGWSDAGDEEAMKECRCLCGELGGGLTHSQTANDLAKDSCPARK